MFCEKQAEALGTVAWQIDSICFPDKRLDRSMRSELLIPAMFFDSNRMQYDVGDWLPCSPSIFGEFLRVDDHLIKDASCREVLRVFLQSVFQPFVVGAGKAIVRWGEPHEGIVFFFKDADINDALGHLRPLGLVDETPMAKFETPNV